MEQAFTPLLRHFLNTVQPADIPTSLKDDVVDVLLESIKFDRNLIEKAPRYWQRNTRPNLGARLALERSISFRLCRRNKKSDLVIQEALSCSTRNMGSADFRSSLANTVQAVGALETL
jgi:hypothetical protein